MLRRLISSKLVVTALLTGSLLCSGLAQAACNNHYIPQAFVYSEVYPDGRRLVQVHGWDSDNMDKRRLLVYQNGRLFQSSPTGFFSGVLARGSGIWEFAHANVDSCGTVRSYGYVAYFRN